MRALSSAILVVLFALAPAAASAVTIEQIVALSKAGVSEPIILALIDRDKTVFTIEPERLAALQREGLSERVIVAMLKSGREEGDASANAASAFNAAAIMSALSVAPEVVIIGHGPDRPNTGYGYGYDNPYWPGPFVPEVIPVPLFYGSPFYGDHRSKRFNKRSFAPALPPPTLTPIPPPPSLSSPALCIAQSTTTSAPPQVGSRGFVTACPPNFR